MAANRYTQFSPQQYVNQFVPEPFQEIAQVGAMRQAKQDQAMEQLAKIEAGVKSIHALPGDQLYAKEQIGKISTDIDAFTNMDFNDPNTRNQWNKQKAVIAQRFAPTGDLGMIDNNYALAGQWKKDILSKSNESGWGSAQLDNFTNQGIMKHKTIGEDGSMNMFQGQGVYNRVDYNKWISAALKDVAADTGDMGLTKYGSLDEVNKAYQTGTIKHLDYTKIMNSLAMRAQGDPALVQSLEQEGKFLGREGMGNFIKGQDKNGNVVVDSSNPFGAILTGTASGAQYREVKTDYKIVKDPVEDARIKAAAKKKAEEEATSSPKTLPSGILVPGLSQYKVHVPGKSMGEGTSFFAKDGEKWNSTPEAGSSGFKFTPEQDELAKKAATFYGRGLPTDAIEKGKLINEYIDDFGKTMQSPTILEYTNPKFIQNQNQRYFSTTEKGGGQAYDREFIGIGTGEKMPGSDFMKKYGDKKEYTISTSGKMTADNPYYSAAEVVTVRDKNGKLVGQYAMEGNESEKTESKWLNDLYSVKYNPVGIKETSIPIYNPDGSFAGTTNFKLDYRRTGTELTNSGKPILPNEELVVQVKDSNGNWVPYKDTFTSETGGDVFNNFLQVINADTNLTPSK